ncbi:MAG: proline--tRNA ligase [Halobacteriota archaeon]|nr:proline--tRNA ligase [Halobacteriota archaeon]
MKEDDFSEWYNDLLWKAQIMDVRYPVKGLYVWYPFGFALRKNVYGILRSLLDEDHSEALFPLLIPKNEFMKEAEHIKGFEEEVYWVDRGGLNKLDVPLALRPTSETAMYPIFKLWVRSHADLPLRIYQIVNTFRHETKHTRPLIRLREITSFKEAHTVHTTWEDAEKQVHDAVKIYKKFFNMLAVPYIISKRPSWDKFPGSDYSIAFDTLMPDGKTLQVGTIHHLGTNFAKTFDIQYEDEDGEQQYANQTCYGISERCIAALISIHGDDKGLVLPPDVAPIQVVIIPIIFSDTHEIVSNTCKNLYRDLKEAGIRVTLDETGERPGAKYYKWELKGVPLRIEIGPRDIESGSAIMVRRGTKVKEKVPLDAIVDQVKSLLLDHQKELQNKSEETFKSRVFDCDSLDQVRDAVNKNIAMIAWCGSEDCGREVEEATDADILGESVTEKRVSNCLICGAKTEMVVYVARTY